MCQQFTLILPKMVGIIDKEGILENPDDPKYVPNPAGCGVHFFNKMKEFADQIAQVDLSSNKSETYGEILIKSTRIALKMKSVGVQEDDIISLCTDIHSNTCLPFWASMFAGIRMANLDPTLALSDFKYLVNLVKPKLIFCVPSSVENLEIVIEELGLPTKLVVFGETEKHMSFKEFVEPQKGEQNFEPRIVGNIFDTSLILFSSGTTGHSKGVCITHYGILNTINMLKDITNMKNVLFYTSPYWISFVVFLTATLISGGARILSKTFDSNKMLQIIQDYKVTFVFLPPTCFYAIEAQADTIDTSSLHTMLVGGGSIKPDQIKKIKTILPTTFINNMYGLSEITILFSAFDPKRDSKIMDSKISSCGKLFPGTTCKIINTETNKIVGKYEKGELCIKTKRLMNGYFNDPQKTAEAFDGDGFLYTGDILYYDDDYFFYVVDRIKEMFKYKSWHIAPSELECILLKHPAVKEGLVIGYPHEEDDDHPMAVVVLNKDIEVTENDILHYFNDKVSDRKKLRGGVKFVETLPKTITGKYNRMKLRAMVINNEI